MRHPELILCAFLSSCLVTIPVIRQWTALNLPVTALALSLVLSNLVSGISAAVWVDNDHSHSTAWCDFATKLLLATQFAVPLACVCIGNRLVMLSSRPTVTCDHRRITRRNIYEGLICFGLPVVFILLHYIVQPNRFDIYENIGCQPSILISIPAIFIIWAPRLLIASVTFIYSLVVLQNFAIRRLTFASDLKMRSDHTISSFILLIAMVMTQAVWAIVVSSYDLSSVIKSGLLPWTGWADVHRNFGTVVVFSPDNLTLVRRSKGVYFSWWMLPVSGFIFFGFLAVGESALGDYGKLWKASKEVFGRPVIIKSNKLILSVPKTSSSNSNNFSMKNMASCSSFFNSSSKNNEVLPHENSLRLDPELALSATSHTLNDTDVAGRVHDLLNFDHVKHSWDIAIPITTRRSLSPIPWSSVAQNCASHPESSPHPSPVPSPRYTSHTFSYCGSYNSSPYNSQPSSLDISMLAPEPSPVFVPQPLPPPPRRVRRPWETKNPVNISQNNN